MNILVTGGAGFIGANHVYYLLQKHPEDRVVCLDALTYAGNLETLKDAMDHPQFRFVHGDISNRETVFSLFEDEKFDAVVNFAAETHVDLCRKSGGVLTDQRHGNPRAPGREPEV